MNDKNKLYTTSRRLTPWTGIAEATPMQVFVDSVFQNLYDERHQAISETPEVDLLNQYPPHECHHCGSHDFIRYGRNCNGVDVYKCKTCGRKFNILTGTIFQNHKIPLTEWIDYCLELFGHVSFNAISKSNRNSLTTTRYWLEKIFMVLEGYQDGIMLSGNVYIDETYRKVIKSEVQFRPDGKEYRGISRNQMCIGIACDSNHMIALYEGNGKTTKQHTLDAFVPHIKPGSHLIHDQEPCHKALVKALTLSSETYNSKLIKKLPDDKNPLAPINWQCYMLQHFFNAHGGYSRRFIQDYLNLFAFIQNEDGTAAEKVEKLLTRAFDCRKTLTYRDKYAK